MASRAIPQPRVGAIYYVSFGGNGPIKIGYVDGFSSLSERLRGLQTACPYNLELLATKVGTLADERALHERYASSRLRGEWFRRTRRLEQHIAGVRRRKDCQLWLPHHERYLPAPEGYEKIYMGTNWFLEKKPAPSPTPAMKGE